MFSRPYRALHVALLPVLLSLPACDSSEGGDNSGGPSGGSGIVGSMNVTVSGAVQTTFTGSAVFAADDEDGFVLTLVNGGPAAPAGDDFKAVSLLGEEGDRPSGTLALGGEGVYTLYTEVEDGDAVVILTADAGEVTFTASSPSRLAGQFAFTGDAADGELNDLGEVTVSGTFDARPYAGFRNGSRPGARTSVG